MPHRQTGNPDVRDLPQRGKKVERDKEGYNIIIKGSNQQENITSSNNEKMLALILVGFLYVYIVRAR